MAILFAPTTAPVGDWHGVFQQQKPPSSPHPSESDHSLTRVDSSHSGGSRSERRQSKSLRNMFGKSKNKTYTPPIPEIGAAADRLPYNNDGPRHRVELTPTELSDDISISRTSTIGGSSLSSGASFIDSPTGAHPPQMSEKLARVFGTKTPLVGPKAERLHPQSEERPATRKRDSFLAVMPKRSLERPPTSAGPSAGTTAAPAPPPAKWEAPPFFKGLSGAVKHGSLMTCGVTANAVIYLSTHDKSGKNVAVTGFGSDPVKADKAKEKHRQRVVETLGKAEWSRKIFVLSSAGYLLQFSCDGAFNRLPEQSIRLSRHSVAFVSDVIPGKHWVIQITTVYDGLSAITPGELSATPAPPAQQRPGSKSTYVKPIKQFLLIMDNGEDLDTWLTAVRHEIDVLGGKASSETTAKSLEATAGHPELSRSPLSETTNAFPSPSPNNEPLYSPRSDDVGNDNNDPLPWETDERTTALPPWPAEDTTPQPSRATNTLSSVPSTKSIEEHLLDSLRDSTARSSGGRTFFTSPSPSRNSSPSRSPLYESFPPALADDEEGRYGFGEFGQQQRPNAAGIRERRQSAQGARPPVLDAILAGTAALSLDDTLDVSTPTNDSTLSARRMARRTPPTALKTRLSIVEDQPSPALQSNDEAAPAISPKSRARRHPRPTIPLPPPRSMRRISSLPGAQGAAFGGASSPPAVAHAPSSSPPPSPTESDDEFQFHHWTSRLSPPPRGGGTSPSLPSADLAPRDGAPDRGSDGASPPPLPLFSYPFPPSSTPPPSDFSDPSLSPRPLVIAPHTARANAKAQAARDKRVSIGGAPGGMVMGAGRERRVSITRGGEAGKRGSFVSRGGGSGGGEGGMGREKRDSIVVMRERRVPPKPLGSRGFIALASEGGGGAAAAASSGQGGYGGGASSAPGGYGGYGGYGTYGGVAGGVSTGRVVKAIDRMVIRERGLSFGERASFERERSFGERSPVPLRSPPLLRAPPPLKSPGMPGGERPVTREGGGRPKSRKGGEGGKVGLGIAGVGGEAVVGPPLAPPPTRGLPPVPPGGGGGGGGRARGMSNAGRG